MLVVIIEDFCHFKDVNSEKYTKNFWLKILILIKKIITIYKLVCECLCQFYVPFNQWCSHMGKGVR